MPIKKKRVKRKTAGTKKFEKKEVNAVRKEVSIPGYVYGLPGKKVNFELAPIYKRVLAFIADLFLFYIVIYSPFMQIYLGQLGIVVTAETIPFLITSLEVKNNILIGLTVLSILLVLYFTLMEYFFGMSVGKLFLKIRVLSTKNNKLTFIQSLVRNIPKNLFFLVTLLPVDCITLLSEKKQRLTEIAVGTKVVSIPEFQLVAEE